MKKLLHWNPRFGNTVGGGEIYIANVIRNMPEFNHLVISDKYWPEQKIEFYKDVESRIVYTNPPFLTKPRFVNFPLSVFSALLRTKFYKSTCEKINPDLHVIHGLGLFETLERLHFSLGIDLVQADYFEDLNPRVLTVHNLFSQFVSKKAVRYLSYEDKIIAQFDIYICVDNNLVAHLKKKFPKKEINFVPNSIPDYFFNSDLKKKYDTKIPVFGFVGRYQIDKGVHILKEMIEKSPKNFKFILIISANHKSIEQIKKEYRSFDNVELHFNISNKQLPNYYKKMDFLFNTVIAKGISRVSLEAMAMGVVPIMIASGDRDPVIDSKTGFLFEMDNVTEIIERIKILTPDQYYKVKKDAQKVCSDKFSNASIIPKLIQIYNRVINNGKK
jgi:glycosyltransferase involved in cell wall biosynthesis